MAEDALDRHRVERELGELLSFEGCGCEGPDESDYDDLCFACRVESILKGPS